MLNNYSRVCLSTNRFQSEGASKDDLGYIIEVYADDRYEVEFSDADGITFSRIVARSEDLQLSEPLPAEPAFL